MMKKIIFLGLDETLVYSSLDPSPETYDFTITLSIDGQIMNFYVLKQSGVDFFLEEIGKKHKMVIFMVGLKQYASQVLYKLNPNGRFISHRIYRYSCREVNEKSVKDLSVMGKDLGELLTSMTTQMFTLCNSRTSSLYDRLWRIVKIGS
ncbi:hypothetical protein V6N13_024189 [Hibiscus sabdariffa]|uniref:Mitochondrial import inner membrane translocase subunit TIM50 n=2 Tax=Hibiscus sabdariffa TaxID=183260 RepID=A0ABR1ZXX3_9ROSI